MTSANAHQRVAVITGASSGIGEATAKNLAALGFHVVAVARRADRITALANEIDGTAIVADVTDDQAVEALAARLSRVDVLVNNAGGARGLEPVVIRDAEQLALDLWSSNEKQLCAAGISPDRISPADGQGGICTPAGIRETHPGVCEERCGRRAGV